MRVQVWVEIPEGYELACEDMRFPKADELVLAGSGAIVGVHPSDGAAMKMLRVIVRPATTKSIEDQITDRLYAMWDGYRWVLHPDTIIVTHPAGESITPNVQGQFSVQDQTVAWKGTLQAAQLLGGGDYQCEYLVTEVAR